jgi:uncharacterized membrane protein YkvA (DUF1232 family)
MTSKGKDKGISKKKAEETLRKGAETVQPADVEKVLKASEALESKFEGGPLQRFFADFKVLFSMLKDYWSGRYRAVPYWTIAAVTFALLYVINPIDLIPDFIPVVGYIDDAMVVAACIALVREDLHKYRKWRADNPE